MWIKQVLSVYDYEKEYRVLVARHPDPDQLNTWRRGVVLADNYRTEPAQVSLEAEHGKGSWLRVVMREGHKRQIRETGSQIGLPVVRIERVRIGSLLLGKLKPREWRYLTAAEVAALKGQPGKVGSRLEKAGTRQKKSRESSRPRSMPEKARRK